MHPLVQWRRLTDDESRTSFADGWDAEQVLEGFLDPEILAEVVDDLSETSGALADLTVGIWEGWGDLHGDGAIYTSSGESEAGAQAEQESSFRERVSPEIRDVIKKIQAEQNARFLQRGKAEPPPLLELPHRRYLLFTSSVVELRNPAWPLTAGIGWSDGRPGVTPQLVWPPDASWCLATEIDFDSTLLGASRAAIDRVLASTALEVFEVNGDDEMTWDGDTVNEERVPEPNRGNPFP